MSNALMNRCLTSIISQIYKNSKKRKPEIQKKKKKRKAINPLKKWVRGFNRDSQKMK